MRNLKKNLKEYLRIYSARSRNFTEKNILEDPAIDLLMSDTLYIKEKLEEQKVLLLPEEKRLLQEADLRFLTTWEKIKDIEPETTPNKIAKAFLKDIVEIIKKSQKHPKTKSPAKRRLSV